jgi:hypothetical protein
MKADFSARWGFNKRKMTLLSLMSVKIEKQEDEKAPMKVTGTCKAGCRCSLITATKPNFDFFHNRDISSRV